MEALCDTNIIGSILRQLEEPLDLLHCSAVSQRWRSACLKAQTFALSFSVPTTAGVQYISGLIHWIQTRHAGGNLSLLKSFTAQLEDKNTVHGELADEHSERLWFVAGAVLMLAGTWPLQRVVIAGRFDFSTTLKLLPASVQYLQLCMHAKALPQVVDLAKFCKFESLKELVVVP